MKRKIVLRSLAIFFILLLIGGYLFLRSDYLLNKIRVVLVEQLQTQLKHPVAIEEISGNILTGLRVKGFKISAKQPEQPDLIAIDEIGVKYTLLGLLRRRFVVTRLDVRAPQVNAVIDRDGKLNLMDLAPEPQPEKPEPRGKLPFQFLVAHISIEDGTIRVDDVSRNLTVTVGGIYSRVDGPEDRWAHSGDLEVRNARFALDGVETKIHEFKTAFAFQKDQGTLNELRLALGNSVLTIAGKARNLTEERPAGETEIHLRLDLGDLQKFLPNQYQVAGLADAEVKASGTLSQITGYFGLKLPSAKFNQLQIENLVTRAEFTQSGVRLTDFHGTIASGTFTGNADVKLTPEGAAYNGSLELIDLKAEQLLPLIADVPLLETTGKLGGKVQFSFARQDLADLKLDGNLQLTGIRLNNRPAGDFDAKCTLADDQVSLTTHLDGAEVKVSGRLGLNGERDIALEVKGVDIGKYAAIFGVPEVTGRIRATGRSTSEIPLSASLRLFDATFRKIPLGVLTGDVIYNSDNRLALKSIRLSNGESQLQLDGSIEVGLEPRPVDEMPFDITLRAQPFQVADYIGFAEVDFPVEGVITGALSVNGTLGRINGNGSFEMNGGKVGDVILDPLTLPITVENSTVKIPDFALSFGGQRGVLTAQLTPELTYAVDFQSEPMRLSALTEAARVPDVPLDADLVVKMSGKGEVNDPRVNLNVDILNPVWKNRGRDSAPTENRGVALGDLHLTVDYAKNAVQIAGSGFDEAMKIQGQLGLTADQPYRFSVKTTDWNITPFLEIASEGKYELAGNVDGALDIAGSLAQPTQLEVNLNLPTLSLQINGQQLINPTPISLKLAENRLHIESFTLADARDRRPFLAMTGGELGDIFPAKDGGWSPEFDQFQIESDGFALEYVASLLGTPPTISGTARYKLGIAGTFDAPQIALSCAIPQLQIQTPTKPVTVSAAEGNLTYKNQQLMLQQVDLNLLGNPIKLRGNVQLNLKNPQASVFNLQSSIENFQLAPLAQLAPQISELAGVLDSTAQVSGSLAEPKLTASVRLKETTIKATDFPLPIEGLTAELRASGGGESPITLDLTSSWQLAGTRYEATGNWHTPKLGADSPVSFQFQCNGKQIDFAKLVKEFSPQETPLTEGSVDLQLTVAGNGYTPDAVSANLTCDNLQFNINQHALRNIEPIRLDFADGKLRVESLQIGQATAWFTGLGSIDLDGNLGLRFQLENIPLAVLLPAATKSLLNTFVEFDGSLASEVTLHGNLTDPVIRARWATSGLVQAVKLADVGNAIYQEKMLTIQEQVRFARSNNSVAVVGRIPIDLSFQPLDFPARLLDLPLDIRFRGNGVRVGFLAAFHPLLKAADGAVDIDFGIAGTTASPHPQGSFSLSDGMLELVGFEKPVTEAAIAVQAKAGELHFPTFRFQIGEGQYESEMRVALEEIRPVDFDMKRFTVKNAHLSDFLPEKNLSAVQGAVTAEARMNVPLSRFIQRGATAWTPETLAFNPQELIKSVKSGLDIQEISVEGLGYQIRNENPIEIRFSDGVLRLENGFALADQNTPASNPQRLQLSGFGRWDMGQALRFNMKMQHFELGLLTAFGAAQNPISGLLNASLDIRGTGEQPELSLEWNTSKLVANGVNIDQFTGKVGYSDGKLRFGTQKEPISLAIGVNRGTLSGLIPLDVSTQNFTVAPLPEEPIECRLDMNIDNLAFLPLAFPQISFADGTGGIHLAVGGPLSSPKLKGFVELNSVVFDVPESFISVEQTNVALDLTERGVTIRQFEGKFNEGEFTIRGAFDWIQPYIDVELTFPNGFTYEFPGFYQMKTRRMDLGMKGQIVTAETLKLPPITGSIQVAEGRYEQSWQELVKNVFAKAADVQTEVVFDVPIVRDLQFDLELVAPNQFKIVSKLGKLDLEIGINGRIVGAIQKPMFVGRVDLLGGEFSFLVLRPRFKVIEGSYIENRSSVEFDPYYEINARTTNPIQAIVFPTLTGLDRIRNLHITAHLKGNLKVQHPPRFEAEVLGKGTEEYQFSQTEILSVLALGRIDPSLSKANVGGDTSLQDLALDQSEQYLSNRVASLLGLSAAQLELNREEFDKSEFLVTKSLSERLALTYASTFGLHGEPRIGVEYQIRRHIAVKGERNEKGRYGVDLKFEQEF